jgi:hypothetical protein
MGKNYLMSPLFTIASKGLYLGTFSIGTESVFLIIVPIFVEEKNLLISGL